MGTDMIEKQIPYSQMNDRKIVVGAIVLKAFKQLHDINPDKYYTVEEFVGKFNMRALVPFVLSEKDFENVIENLRIGFVIKEDSQNPKHYRFGNINGNGLIEA